MTSKRITQHMIELRFDLLRQAAHKPQAQYIRHGDGSQGTSLEQVFGWALDHSSDPRAAGWVIIETLPSGGESRPTGSMRRTKRELWDFMGGILYGIDLEKEHDPECDHCGRARDDHWCQDLSQTFEVEA